MKNLALLFSIVLVFLLIDPSVSRAQVENVPVYHPMYAFLKRMELEGVIEKYHDAILPLSRREIAEFLEIIDRRRSELTPVEQSTLDDYLVEFQFDMKGSTEGFQPFLDFSNQSFGESFNQIFTEKEKFLYTYHDSSLSLFVDGLLTVDGRKSTGDALGDQRAEFLQFGGRIRGTIHGNIGYSLQGTNAQFWGSRNVLQRDKFLSQDFTLAVTDAQNFDQVDGYLRYETRPLSVQVGRERILWGNGYSDKLVVSDNARDFDAIRWDAQYKGFKYTYVHGWLLGRTSKLTFTLGSDPTLFNEPVTDDKYIAAHRFEMSFPNAIDLGFQEIEIYSNRAPDLSYLNPVTFLESSQRARNERDNGLWAFDFQAHWVRGWELEGTIDFDDLAFQKWGTNDTQNKDAKQIGIMGIDPFGVPNTNVAVEYTRIEPYTFSHSRSRDNSYTNNGRMLGEHLQPNSESWFFRLENFWTSRFRTRVSFENERHGANILAPNGTLILNVGGDILQPERPQDSRQKDFLGGNLEQTVRWKANASFELYKEVFLEGFFIHESVNHVTQGFSVSNNDFGVDLRLDF